LVRAEESTLLPSNNLAKRRGEVGALFSIWNELDKQYGDINPISQIVIGVVFAIIGTGISLMLMQAGGMPIVCVMAGWMVAAFGIYLVFRAIKGMPAESRYGTEIEIIFTGAELLAIIQVIEFCERLSKNNPGTTVADYYAGLVPIGQEIERVALPDPRDPNRVIRADETATITLPALTWSRWLVTILDTRKAGVPITPELQSAVRAIYFVVPESAQAVARAIDTE
jgi:hypothetical protein